MKQRGARLTTALGVALVGLACSSAASKVVDQYFNALRANDTNTLTSFAMVAFEDKVDAWKIVAEGPEVKTEATLPELMKRQKQLQAELEENTKNARAWGNDLEIYPKLEKVREAQKKDAKIPASLQPIADKWNEFQDEDRRLKKAVAEAKDAVAREKRNVTMSIGQVDDLETLTGEAISRDMDLELTIDGQAKPYTMTLRRYDLKAGESAGRMMSRWVVQSLEPKA